MGRSADLPRQSGETDGDDTGCNVLHVDMDAFFASVEIRSRPELAGLPVVVGGSGGRGVVAAASYPARRFGVRSAMPMGQALRLCPALVIVAPTRAAYGEASRAVFKIFSEFTPLIEPMSLDEAFLDVSGALGVLGRPADIARQIRRRIWQDQQLTCSVGIAPARSIAKLASGTCKPDGLRVVGKDDVLAFLHPLPVTALQGVGAKTVQPLHRLGIRTVADLARTPMDTLRRAVGDGAAAHLLTLANGLDTSPVRARGQEKSISSDRTVLDDLLTGQAVAAELLRGASDVAKRLRQSGHTARTVGIKIRFADFHTVTRVRTLSLATDSTAAIYDAALSLYRAMNLDRPRIRLVGVKVENLRPADEPTQLALSFDPLGVPGHPTGSVELDVPVRSDVPVPDLHAAPAPTPDKDHTSAGRAARSTDSLDRTVDRLAVRFPGALLGPATLLRRAEVASGAVRRRGEPDRFNDA